MGGRFLKYYSLFLPLLVFYACTKVKYPENDKKIRKPQRYELMRGYITGYKVNGVDSLEALDNYWFNAHKYRLSSLALETTFSYERKMVYNAEFGSLYYSWTNNYKALVVKYYPPDKRTSYPNIFIENGLIWEILKFAPSKKSVNFPLKIKTEINGKSYEVEFN